MFVRVQSKALERLGLLVLLQTVAVLVLAQSPSPRLDFADKVKMLDCEPVSSNPCFRASLNIVNAQGEPYAVALPAADQLAASLTFTIDGQAVKPFYASAGGSGSKTARGRLALIEVDVSGSMNRRLVTGETRFEAAKAALEKFLENFQDGVDRVAIVPFESHNVVTNIRSAVFATTKEQALAQVNNLPAPEARNNTALFSAVYTGVDVVAEQSKLAAADGVESNLPETMLVVMTDGKNDVLPGDDLGLLSGPKGLNQVSAKVRGSQLQVIGVGFGEAAEVDGDALGKLSTKYYMANDAAGLQAIFSIARKLLMDRIQVAFLSPLPDRASLGGRSLKMQADLRLPDGSRLQSNEIAFNTPQMGLPLFEGKASTDELRALINSKPPAARGWVSIARPLLVFLGLGSLLLIAWFWVPRLVWPEQYIGKIPVYGNSARWSNQTGVRRSAEQSRDLPPGFGRKSGYGAGRTPGDATVVQWRPESTATRIRLQKEERRNPQNG